jgi:hypothetical protein
MGVLNYGTSSPHPIEFDDRTLAHLQVVIGSKLRQRQSFFFSWLESVDGGSGRGSIWIDAAIPLTFSYKTSQRFTINREWLEILMTLANSSSGLQLAPEPEEPRPLTAPIALVERPRSSAEHLVRS